MLIAQAPLRMSFVGGGSDLPAFYRQHGGAVVSTTIDKYLYVAVHPTFDGSLQVGHDTLEQVAGADAVQHPLVRESLRLLGIRGGLRIAVFSDVPTRGTGLGSSSSLTVALLHALHASRGHEVTPGELARQACEVELERVGSPIGRQDQYAAACGGLNYIEFHPDDSVSVHPISCGPEVLETLERRLLLLHTGLARRSATLLQGQGEALRTRPQARELVRRGVELARRLRGELEAGRLEGFGALLDEHWQLKRRTGEGVSLPAIDAWYERARAAGAEGGKLLGAGGGGFLLLYAPEERHPAILQALGELRPLRVRLEPRGSRVTRLLQSGGA